MSAALSGVDYRPGHPDDLEACARIWKAAIDGYQVRLNQPPAPDELGPIRRLLDHLLATDPDRYWVAVRAAFTPDPGAGRNGRNPGPETVVGFASATVRGPLWFLAMLFVDPAAQGSGIGGALMDRAQAGRDVDPGGPAVPGPDDALDTGIRTWGMCTDSAQPISNAIYARRGMVPRIAVWRLLGEVRRWAALPVPPRSLEVVPLEVAEGRDVEGRGRTADALAEIDREILGFEHPQDHAWLRREGRVGVLLRDRGDGRPLGYAYGSNVGRLGPVAALDPALQPTLIGAAIRAAPAFGPVALWVPGTADVAMRSLLDAGLRLDGFPGLVCWSSVEHPFQRYAPISLAIV